MSRRLSNGLKNIFSRPDIQPTPYKRRNQNDATDKPKQARLSLHDDIWDANTAKVSKSTTPTAQAPRRQSLKTTPSVRAAPSAGAPARTPQGPSQSPELAEMAREVYGKLSSRGFEAATGLKPPGSPAQTPMNTDIIKMFEFLFGLIMPDHRPGATIVEQLDDLGYTGMDNSFKRNFSGSHVLANTPSMWPKILHALFFLTKLNDLKHTRVDSDDDHQDEERYLATLDEQFVHSRFFGYEDDTVTVTFRSFLELVEQQAGESINSIALIAQRKTQTEAANAKIISIKSENEAAQRDIASLEEYLTQKPLELKALEQRLDTINMQLITETEALSMLEQEKIECARHIEEAGFSVAKLEDCEYEQRILQEDLDGFKTKRPELEAQSRALREKCAGLRKKIKALLEQVCEKQSETVPQESEWPEAVVELFSTLDGLRRDLVLKTAAIEEENISVKINAAAFNSQFDSMQSKQTRLEGAIHNAKEQNAFRVRELEIKKALINQKFVSMEKHCADIMRESQLEHSNTREQQLKAEQEGVRLDSEAEQSIRTITSKARMKLRQFDKAEAALLPGLRQLGSSADEYAKLASQISKMASQFKIPQAPRDKGTREERVRSLMSKWQRAVRDAAA